MQSEMAKLFVNSGDPGPSLYLSELGNGNFSSFHLYVFFLFFVFVFLFLQICKLPTDSDSNHCTYNILCML